MTPRILQFHFSCWEKKNECFFLWRQCGASVVFIYTLVKICYSDMKSSGFGYVFIFERQTRKMQASYRMWCNSAYESKSGSFFLWYWKEKALALSQDSQSCAQQAELQAYLQIPTHFVTGIKGGWSLKCCWFWWDLESVSEDMSSLTMKHVKL